MSPEAVEIYKWTWEFVLGDFWHFIGFWLLVGAFTPFQLVPRFLNLTVKRGS